MSPCVPLRRPGRDEMPADSLRQRFRAAGLHLAASLAVAAIAAGLVFGLWYPGAFRVLSGGQSLFLLVVTVDVIVGPLLTFTVFNRAKPARELRRDLAVIAVLQLAALGYGLHIVHEARPVAMVFEVDRFRVLTTEDVALLELPEALPAYRELPQDGPWLLAARVPSAAENTDALFGAVNGVDTGQRPMFWQPYDVAAKARAIARARPVVQLLDHDPAHANAMRASLASFGVDASTARFLPVVARTEAVAVLDPAGDIRGYLYVDGFF